MKIYEWKQLSLFVSRYFARLKIKNAVCNIQMKEEETIYISVLSERVTRNTSNVFKDPMFTINSLDFGIKQYSNAINIAV